MIIHKNKVIGSNIKSSSVSKAPTVITKYNDKFLIDKNIIYLP